MDKMVELLSKIMNKQEAKVLLYLRKHDHATGIEIEENTDMRQPQMCIATKELIKKKLIIGEYDKSSGKGRPKFKYTLDAVKTKNYLQELIEKKKKEIQEIEEAIKEF